MHPLTNVSLVINYTGGWSNPHGFQSFQCCMLWIDIYLNTFFDLTWFEQAWVGYMGTRGSEAGIKHRENSYILLYLLDVTACTSFLHASIQIWLVTSWGSVPANLMSRLADMHNPASLVNKDYINIVIRESWEMLICHFHSEARDSFICKIAEHLPVRLETVPFAELIIGIMTSKNKDILNALAKFVYLEFKRREAELCPGHDYTLKCHLSKKKY